MVRTGRIVIQCKTFLLDKKSKNSCDSQQPSKTNPGIEVVYPSSYHAVEKQEPRILQYGAQNIVKLLIVEPQLNFTHTPITNQMNLVATDVVDITLPPPMLTKKEKEDNEAHTTNNMKVPQKEEELLKVIQMVAQSLQQQILLGICTADMSHQHTVI